MEIEEIGNFPNLIKGAKRVDEVICGNRQNSLEPHGYIPYISVRRSWPFAMNCLRQESLLVAQWLLSKDTPRE